MIVGSAGVLVIFLIGYLFGSRPKPNVSTVRPTAQNEAVRRISDPTEELWLRKLLEITRGNKGAVERGVMATRRRHPRASRAEAMEMLYHDYLRDRS